MTSKKMSQINSVTNNEYVFHWEADEVGLNAHFAARVFVEKNAGGRTLAARPSLGHRRRAFFPLSRMSSMIQHAAGSETSSAMSRVSDTVLELSVPTP